MACCALVAGITGFFLANNRSFPEPEWMSPVLTPSNYPRFMADWFAHSASYASAFLGGPVLCMLQYRKRALRAPQPNFGPEDGGLDGRKAAVECTACNLGVTHALVVAEQ
jgi:hypothetical protein